MGQGSRESSRDKGQLDAPAEDCCALQEVTACCPHSSRIPRDSSGHQLRGQHVFTILFVMHAPDFLGTLLVSVASVWRCKIRFPLCYYLRGVYRSFVVLPEARLYLPGNLLKLQI